MIIGNGSALLYRGTAAFQSQAQRETIIKYLRGLENAACAFDNTIESNILIVDFDKAPDRDAFTLRFGQQPVLALAA